MDVPEARLHFISGSAGTKPSFVRQWSLFADASDGAGKFLHVSTSDGSANPAEDRQKRAQ